MTIRISSKNFPRALEAVGNNISTQLKNSAARAYAKSVRDNVARDRNFLAGSVGVGVDDEVFSGGGKPGRRPPFESTIKKSVSPDQNVFITLDANQDGREYSELIFRGRKPDKDGIVRGSLQQPRGQEDIIDGMNEKLVEEDGFSRGLASKRGIPRAVKS